ncbi:MAG: hypothetical protein ACRDRA_13800 [Pseudonocardiaceae bacterium]
MVIKSDGTEITRRFGVVPVNCWYLRSLADADTHRGQLRPDGIVVAECGVRFQPPPIVPNGPALPDYPPDGSTDVSVGGFS